MPKIIIQTIINSEIEICFDLSRSIDLHQISTAQTNEKAIDGKTTGLIDFGEFVTWEARHFGITQKLTSKITAFKRPFHFRDEQISGAFKSFKHDHYFETINDKVMMKDIFEFESPLGYLGKLFNQLILTDYMKKLLIKRNNTIRDYAENGSWRSILRNP